MNPHIIIDAWDFNGFASEDFETGETINGLTGLNIRVRSKGYLEIDTSWGLETYGPGDRIVILDIASCLSKNSLWFNMFEKDPIKVINTIFLHELSHWAEEVHRSGNEHGLKWNPFLSSLLNRREEN